MLRFAQEKASLQGVGSDDFHKYGMATLSDRQLSDFCGNAFSICNMILYF